MDEFDSIIVSSRIRLARNFSDIVFPNKIKKSADALVVINRVFGVLKDYENYKVKDLSVDTLSSLKEKHLISEDLTKNHEFGALSLSHDEQICVMINEEEHIREQCILKGFDLDEALARLNEIDDILLENLPIAFSNSYGFLTTCPSNLGTGLRASVMLFLPALTLSGAIKSLIETLSNVGLTVRGQFGENTEADGYLYQISNCQTLGLSEQQIIDNVKTAVIKICQKELEARSQLLSANLDELKDKIFRAYGVLKYAKKMSSTEAINFLSQLKFGVSLGLIENVDIKTIDGLLEDVLPSTLRVIYGEEISDQELEKYRCKYIQQKI